MTQFGCSLNTILCVLDLNCREIICEVCKQTEANAIEKHLLDKNIRFSSTDIYRIQFVVFISFKPQSVQIRQFKQEKVLVTHLCKKIKLVSIGEVRNGMDFHLPGYSACRREEVTRVRVPSCKNTVICSRCLLMYEKRLCGLKQ